MESPGKVGRGIDQIPRPAGGLRLVDVNPAAGDLEISQAVTFDNNRPIKVVAVYRAATMDDAVQGFFPGMVAGAGALPVRHLGDRVDRRQRFQEIRIAGVGAPVMMNLIDVGLGQLRQRPGIAVRNGLIQNPLLLLVVDGVSPGQEDTLPAADLDQAGPGIVTPATRWVGIGA